MNHPSKAESEGKGTGGLPAEERLGRVLDAPPGAEGRGDLEVPLGRRSYRIEFRAGGRRRMGERIGELFPGVRRAVVVTNPTVGALYYDDVAAALSASGIAPHRVDVPDSETAKSLQEVERVLEDLIAHRFERVEPVIALGGGVVGDLAGFVASIYLRSVPFVQVPTTLLAQVDSSVGGKTGVNSPQGKNLIGTFYQPAHVMIDVEVLRTLPDVEYRAGMAEVVKYGMIRDLPFFAFLENQVDRVVARDPEVLEQIIFRSCANKAQVVMADERERGERALLNFGHTLGHAFETLGRFTGLRHGEAVALGMVFASRLSRVLGHCDERVESRLVALLSALGLPTRPADWTARQCLEVMTLDKKVRGGKVRFVLVHGVGKAFLQPMAFSEIEPVLDAFLSERC